MTRYSFFILLFWPFWTAASVLFTQEDSGFDKEIEQALKEKEAEAGKKDQKEQNESASEAEPGNSQVRPLIDKTSLPDIMVSVDLTGSFDFPGDEADTQAVDQDSVNVREVEFGLSGAIDHWGLGTVLFAVHNEAGAFFVELHEVYFEFNQLPWNIFLKAGRFFMDVGRLNSIHRHDWKFTQAPLVHLNLFDPEGVADFGGELSYLMPWPFYQEIKAGVFLGRVFGHSHGAGIEKPHPLYTARLKNFLNIIDTLGTQFGATYMRYNIDEDPGNYWHTGGLDVTFKWYRGKNMSLEFSSEFWYRNTKSANDVDQNQYGYYSFIEFQPWRIWYFGFRWDHFILQDSFDPRRDEKVDKSDFSQSVWVTLRPSEFSYFRITFERQDFYGKNDQYLVLLQADFLLGFHPPHKY